MPDKAEHDHADYLLQDNLLTTTHVTTDDVTMSEFVTKLIDDAVLQDASDIHIEPFADHCRIRFRRNGLLAEITSIPLHFATRLIMRIKILAHLNIAERRLPQDGRLFLPSSTLDIRINTCPTLFGEKIALRLLNANKIRLTIPELGMTNAQQQLFLSALQQPEGLILVTGPTGSGKTITLYSALQHLNQIEKNIATVEDPVEMTLAGINQINIHPRIGLDFALALRALLRQDPDILMIGEIRDLQTANIAIQAAQTGHLVLSTLHANHAIDTIARLQSLGANTQHFIHTISLIIAQRLIRRLCNHCKVRIDEYFTAEGCERCDQGYKGRIGIFECLPVTKKIASLILNGDTSSQLLETENCMSLREAGMNIVQSSVTSYAELLRVLGNN